MFIIEVKRTFDSPTAVFKASRSTRVVATGFSETIWIPLRAAASDASAFR